MVAKRRRCILVVGAAVWALWSCTIDSNVPVDHRLLVGSWQQVAESHDIYLAGDPATVAFTETDYVWIDNGYYTEQGTYEFDRAEHALIEHAAMIRTEGGNMRPIEDHEHQRFEHHSVVLTNGRLSRITYAGSSDNLVGEWTCLGNEAYYSRLGSGEYLAFEQKDMKITFSDSQVVWTAFNYWYDETGTVVDTEAITGVHDIVEITPDYYVLNVDGEQWYYPYTITNVGDRRLFFHDLQSFEKME